MPPIVPNRVVFERTLERSTDDGGYGNAALQRTLHIVQVSSQNLRRYTQALAPELAVLWFSGASAASGRGAIMTHIPAEGFHWPWYVELAAERGWRLSMHKGISPVEFRHLWHAGEARSAPWRF